MSKAKICSQSDINQIAAALKRGAAAVLPTDTVYGLCVCACAPGALAKFNKIKNNPPGKPPQVLCTREQAFKLAVADAEFEDAASSWPGALTIIAKASPEGRKLLGGAQTIGLRVSAGGFITRLLEVLDAPLFASSANLHGQQTCETEGEIRYTFMDKADIIVFCGYIKNRPSAVIDISGPQKRIIR